MRYLVIDTCTERGLIAYGSAENILFEKELPFGLNQSKFLLPTLKESLKPHGARPKVDAIGVTMGPGSYTGIRIGVAVAQAIAYSWKVPLIGIPSLVGFIPSVTGIKFAAVLDARIGGLYFQKGIRLDEGVCFDGAPQNCSLEEAEVVLDGVTHLVSPYVKVLRGKMETLYPLANWNWEEQSPSTKILLQHFEQKHQQGECVKPPDHLNLLYLRKTEAERALG